MLEETPTSIETPMVPIAKKVTEKRDFYLALVLIGFLIGEKCHL